VSCEDVAAAVAFVDVAVVDVAVVAVAAVVAASCTQLEAINFTGAQTMRKEKGEKSGRQWDRNVGEKLGKMSKTIMSQKFPTL